MNPRDITTGQRFERWTVIGPGESKSGHKGVGPWFLCRCDCGTEKHVWGHSLVARRPTRSCGCLRRERCADSARRRFTKHGHNRSRKNGNRATKEYRAWSAMIRRCIYPSMQDYPRYGGRGTTVCDRWRKSFEAFLADVGPAPSDRHTLDRKDNDGHYEPGNVRWATTAEQSRNMRTNRFITAFGRTLIANDWAKETGINRQTILARLARGVPAEEALTRPPKK